MTGVLSAIGLMCTNGRTTTGTTTFNTNITLPTTYNLSPNTATSKATQLGGIFNVTASATADISSSTASLCNITLSVGVWSFNCRILLLATTNLSTTSAYVLALSFANKTLDANTRISHNVSSP